MLIELSYSRRIYFLRPIRCICSSGQEKKLFFSLSHSLRLCYIDPNVCSILIERNRESFLYVLDTIRKPIRRECEKRKVFFRFFFCMPGFFFKAEQFASGKALNYVPPTVFKGLSLYHYSSLLWSCAKTKTVGNLRRGGPDDFHSILKSRHPFLFRHKSKHSRCWKLADKIVNLEKVSIIRKDLI